MGLPAMLEPLSLAAVPAAAAAVAWCPAAAATALCCLPLRRPPLCALTAVRGLSCVSSCAKKHSCGREAAQSSNAVQCRAHASIRLGGGCVSCRLLGQQGCWDISVGGA